MEILKRIIICIYILTMIIIAPGCWDNRDVNDRTFVAAIGIDKGEDKPIEISIQILKPSVMKAHIEGNMGESSIWVSSTTGDTVFEAIREQLKTVNRKPYYAHLRLIIIGEEMAKEGISDILDLFLRNHEVRITPKIIIVKDFKAKDLVGAESKLEHIPALHLEGILKNNIAEAKTRDVDLINIVHELTAAHGSTVIATAIANNKEDFKNIRDIKIEGSAVLRKDKLIAYLDGYQTRGYLFIKDELEDVIINLVNPKKKDKKVAIEVINAKSNMDIKIDGEGLTLNIKVDLRGGLAEEHGSADLANEEMIVELEKELEKEIENNIKDVIELGQKTYKTDFFGFGNKVNAKYPNYWKDIKDQWDDEFTKLPVNINIKAKLERTGIFSKPIQIQ